MRPIWTVSALLAVVLGVAACNGSATNVPNVRGKSQTDAEAAIKKACPEAQVSYQPADILIQAGKQKVNMHNVVVESQDTKLSGVVPTPKRAPSASPLPRPSGRGCSDSGTMTVTLTLKVKVPKLVDLTAEQAQVLLREHGLEAAGKPKAEHKVLNQDPPEGQEIQFTKVPAATVVLGLAAKMPRIVGLKVKDACALLTRVDLTCDPNDAKQPEWVVQSQTPRPDDYVALGTKVRFVAKVGSTLVPVPNVKNRGRVEACNMIKAAGLTCKDEESDDTYGDEPFPVINSDPTAGAMVGPGAEVTIWVPQPRRVPQLTDRTPDDACDLVKQMELKCETKFDPTIKKSDTVETQSPSKGTMLKKGETVTITIPSGIEVPDIVGLSVHDACEELRTRELDCDRGGFSPDWTVTEQTAEAWQLVKTDTKVTLKAHQPEIPCGGVKIVGMCIDPIALIGTGVAVAGFILAVLEYRRRHRKD